MSQRRSSQSDRASRRGRLHVTAQDPAAGDNAEDRLLSGAHPGFDRLPQPGPSLGRSSRECAHAREVEVGPR